MNETNNKRFNVYHANIDYADVVNGTIKNRCIFDEHHYRKRGQIMTGEEYIEEHRKRVANMTLAQARDYPQIL